MLERGLGLRLVRKIYLVIIETMTHCSVELYGNSKN